MLIIDYNTRLPYPKLPKKEPKMAKILYVAWPKEGTIHSHDEYKKLLETARHTVDSIDMSSHINDLATAAQMIKEKAAEYDAVILAQGFSHTPASETDIAAQRNLLETVAQSGKKLVVLEDHAENTIGWMYALSGNNLDFSASKAEFFPAAKRYASDLPKTVDELLGVSRADKIGSSPANFWLR